MEKTVFYLRIAGLVVEVRTIYGDCKTMCGEYVMNVSSNRKADFIVDIVPRNIMRENDEFQNKNRQYPGIYVYQSPGYLEFFAVQRKISEAMPFFDTILMHGAVVAYQNSAYMFSAPSNTGKSTRAQLWLKEFPDSFVVNGDKPFLQINNNVVYACGSPWSGKEHLNTNVDVPLKAIYILKRAETNLDNNLEELSASEAYFALLDQVYKPRNPEALSKTLFLLREICKKVKIYRFNSAPTLEAVRLAYETANNG